MNKAVIHILRAPIIGGTEKLSSYVAHYSTLDQCSNIVVCISGESSKSFESLYSDNCSFVYLNQRLRNFFVIQKYFNELITNLAKVVDEIVLLGWYPFISFFLPLQHQKLLHIGTHSSAYNSFHKCFLLLAAYWPNTRVFCCSNYVRNSFVGLPSNTVTVSNPTYYGPPLNCQKDCSETISKTFFFVGRLEKIKNIRKTINCFNSISSLLEFTALYLIGKNNDLLASSVSNPNIHLLGVSEDPWSLLPPQSVLIFFPSKVEGFGLVIFEALNRGHRVITWNKYISASLLRSSDRVYFFDENFTCDHSLIFFLSNQPTSSIEASLNVPLVSPHEYTNFILSL